MNALLVKRRNEVLTEVPEVAAAFEYVRDRSTVLLADR